MRLPVAIRVLLGLAGVAALVVGLLMWANPADFSGLNAAPDHYSHAVAIGPARGGLFLAAAVLVGSAVAPTLKHLFWGLAVAATTLGVGLFFGLFWGLGVGSTLDDVLTTETRSFLFFWPLVLLVSTFVGGLVGTRSFRSASMTSVAAVLVGGLVWAVGPLVGVEDGPAAFMFVGVGLVVFGVRTWTRRPQSLRTRRDESPTRT